MFSTGQTFSKRGALKPLLCPSAWSGELPPSLLPCGHVLELTGWAEIQVFLLRTFVREP